MRHVLIPFLLFLMTPCLASQVVGGHWSERMRFDAAGSLNDFGMSIAGIGDVDGDGIRDIAIGAPKADNGFVRRSGAVYVYSGATGSLLWTAFGPGASTYLGQVVSRIGDINGDGIDEVSSGAYFANTSAFDGAGSVYVFSGLDGSILLQIDGTEYDENLGLAIADAGDISGDGIPDLVIGSPRADVNGVFNAGKIMVCSGVDGSVLFEFEGTNRLEQMGSNVAGCGDVDGDLVPDIMCSMPLFGGEQGKVFVFSGATGQSIWEFVGSGQEILGNSLTGRHDVDLDGVPDLLLGAMKAKVGSEFGAGTVYLYSGATGALIRQWDGSEGNGHFGYSADFLGDLDGDQVPEILIGARDETALGERGAGRVYVYSGASGDLLYSVDGPGEYAYAGSSVSALGDLNGDGFDEFGFGLPNDSSGGLSRAGSAMVHGFSPILALEANTISAGAGETVEVYIDFPESEAGFNYAVLVSSTGDSTSVIGGIDVPLTTDVMLQRGLMGRAPNILMDAYGILDGDGDASALYLPARNLRQLVGSTYWGAVISYDVAAGEARMSSIARALEIVL